jgi:hypothetical protein
MDGFPSGGVAAAPAGLSPTGGGTDGPGAGPGAGAFAGAAGAGVTGAGDGCEAQAATRDTRRTRRALIAVAML